MIQQIRAKYHLDKPVLQRMGLYLGQLAPGEGVLLTYWLTRIAR